jgi:small-conductance mechanosensitive channel
MTENDSFYSRAERRIEYFTLGLGILAALAAAGKWGWRHGVGILVGAALAWINYRWLKQGLDVLAQLAVAQADAEKVRIPKRVYVKFFARYALIIAVVYVILRGSLLPVAAVLGGLFTLVGAALIEMLYQLTGGAGQSRAR